MAERRKQTLGDRIRYAPTRPERKAAEKAEKAAAVRQQRISNASPYAVYVFLDKAIQENLALQRGNRKVYKELARQGVDRGTLLIKYNQMSEARSALRRRMKERGIPVQPTQVVSKWLRTVRFGPSGRENLSKSHSNSDLVFMLRTGMTKKDARRLIAHEVLMTSRDMAAFLGREATIIYDAAKKARENKEGRTEASQGSDTRGTRGRHRKAKSDMPAPEPQREEPDRKVPEPQREEPYYQLSRDTSLRSPDAQRGNETRNGKGEKILSEIIEPDHTDKKE